MKHLRIRVADLCILVHYRYDSFEKQCERWLDVSDQATDIEVSVTDEEIEKEFLEFPTENVSRAMCESVCIYREIAKRLHTFSAFVMHGAVLEVDGRAYVFTAKSGVGKTTHTKLWIEHFQGRASYINGDKPILRCIDGTWYAYGTPWMGKEQYGEPKSAPVQAICFVERGEINEIHSIDSKEVVGRIFHQLYMPKDGATMMKFLGLVDDMVCKLPFYVLKCTISEQAVEIAYEAMHVGC